MNNKEELEKLKVGDTVLIEYLRLNEYSFATVKRFTTKWIVVCLKDTNKERKFYKDGWEVNNNSFYSNHILVIPTDEILEKIERRHKIYEIKRTIDIIKHNMEKCSIDLLEKTIEFFDTNYSEILK